MASQAKGILMLKWLKKLVTRTRRLSHKAPYSPLSFNLVVQCNNLYALRLFRGYLANYELWDSPTAFQSRMVRIVRRFVDRQAMKTLKEIQDELAKIKSLSVPKDSKTYLMGALLTCKHTKAKTAVELFQEFAEAELEFDRIKSGKPSVVVG